MTIRDQWASFATGCVVSLGAVCLTGFLSPIEGNGPISNLCNLRVYSGGEKILSFDGTNYPNPNEYGRCVVIDPKTKKRVYFVADWVAFER